MSIPPASYPYLRDESYIDIDELRVQQAALKKQGRLHWGHWLIVGLSVVITVLAWQASRSALEERTLLRFEQESVRVINLMQERLKHYEDALLAGVAAMQIQDGEMTREQWRTFTRYLDLADRYPGINGIGVIHHVETSLLDNFVERVRQDSPGFTVHPDHEFDFHLPITYIEPEQSNAAAVGLDVAFETNRRTAALRARRFGTTQISGPIVLVQDAGKTPGFLFYAPYYQQQDGQQEAEQSPISYAPVLRKRTFRGLVYAPLIVRTLVAGVLGSGNRQISLTIRDGDTVLYQEAEQEDGWQAPFVIRQKVPLYGRQWMFDIKSTQAFSVSSGMDQPMVVLISGLTVDLMLLLLFCLMSRSNQRTLDLAETMTNSLSTQAVSISESNRDLESFAHVVSHDLKTPIRGIQDLTTFLKEDLEDYLASNDANPDVQSSLDGLQDQATKSQTLISGILEYSIVGCVEERQSRVDSRALVTSIVESLQLELGQLTLTGDFPVFMTQAVRLEQVLSNLIGNAIKYNESSSPQVYVGVARKGDFFHFSIQDNGPGIDARYHERIFEPFTTLQIRTDIHSSGIGLSIVKRSVEILGGRVLVESEVGQGTTFHFTWPAAEHELGFQRSA